MRFDLGSKVLVALAVVVASAASSQAPKKKKVLFVNSYHQGYEWSDGEEIGAAEILQHRSDVELQFYRMDTKRHGDEQFLKGQIQRVKELIDSSKPDVVIASDDNATKALVQHFKDVAMPWVFCGVNWDASRYGLPFKNATGMTEVSLTRDLIEELKTHAKGQRVGFLTADTETERTEARSLKEIEKLQFAREVFVKTFADWKKNFRQMQQEVDVLVLGTSAGINDWDRDEARQWAQENSVVPSGATYDFMMLYAMLGMTKVPEEQGNWAAKTAMAILNGASPSSIPITPNKQFQLFVNKRLSSKVGVVFAPWLLKRAHVIE